MNKTMLRTLEREIAQRIQAAKIALRGNRFRVPDDDRQFAGMTFKIVDVVFEQDIGLKVCGEDPRARWRGRPIVYPARSVLILPAAKSLT